MQRANVRTFTRCSGELSATTSRIADTHSGRSKSTSVWLNPDSPASIRLQTSVARHLRTLPTWRLLHPRMATATGPMLDLGLSQVVGLSFQNVFTAFSERYRTCAAPRGAVSKYAADDPPEWKQTFWTVVFFDS